MRSTPWSRRRTFRNPLGMVVTLAAIVAIAVVFGLLLPPEPAVTGRASAVDGDTLRISGARIRLLGLDAVEHDQTCLDAKAAEWQCGREARSFLDSVVDGGTTTCVSEGRDQYRRILAHCSTNAVDLGEQVVRAGWAVADLEYGFALAEARLNGRGIWSGRFDDPSEWRRNHGTETFDFWSWLMAMFGR
jgi:endonuclease YncB( thermonuclease family)